MLGNVGGSIDILVQSWKSRARGLSFQFPVSSFYVCLGAHDGNYDDRGDYIDVVDNLDDYDGKEDNYKEILSALGFQGYGATTTTTRTTTTMTMSTTTKQ